MIKCVLRMTGQEHCIEDESNGQLDAFWDWLPKATYEGKTKYHEVSYDLWGYTVSFIVNHLTQ